MVEDPLGDIVDGVRARLQDELETQLRAVSERHRQALEEARQRIEAEADERCAGRLESLAAELQSIRADQQAHVEAAVAAVRERLEAQAADGAERARQELEEACDAERQLAEARLDAERREAAEQRDEAQRTFEAERAQWVESAVGRPAAGSPAPEGLARGLEQIDSAASVSESLAAIARAAAGEASRAAIFLASGSQLEEWTVSGLPSLSNGPLDIHDSSSSPVVQALTTRQAIRSNGSACAVPLLLDGTPIGVLYGEVDAEAASTPGWRDSLEVVARFGAAHLASLTALRTAQASHWLAPSSAGAADDTDVASARRYARLVVSEIKLYNEPAVHAGRSRRDLLERLKPEIERARRLYEERVPASLAGRAEYFHQELVQTLAGGDSSLLG